MLMMFQFISNRSLQRLCLVLMCLVYFSGCQNLRQKTRYWWNNGKRVGPNYSRPAADVATDYRDADYPSIDSSMLSSYRWWEVFNDPDLNLLIEEVYQQNLTLKAAANRIAESRALRNIAAANLLPQDQFASGRYADTQTSLSSPTAFPGVPLTIDDWSLGFDATWEIDLWGRIRRGVDAADAQLCASIKDYDFALVTLIGDVASLYVQIRSLDERLVLAKRNVVNQEGNLDIAKRRQEAGRTSKLDVVQAESNLASTRSLIPQLELSRRQALNALAVLLAIPPSEVGFLSEKGGKIPEIPEQAIVGIPADLLLRRPDLRAAERQMAAQFEQIGIAEADLYPTFVISGTLGYQAARFTDLFDTNAFTGTVAPGFRWNLLNFGRLQNNIRVQEARFNQIRFDFENLVLGAQREVEDGIIQFIKYNEQYVFDAQNAKANAEAVELATVLYREGQEDFGRVFVVQSNLVLAQDQLVATKANIALALINTYKALGGGWEIRCEQEQAIDIPVGSAAPTITPAVAPENGPAGLELEAQDGLIEPVEN